MKRIALSSLILLFVGAMLYVGTTGAFFSDTETSTGNTFTAGAIDLKIDNESYYNGEPNQGTSWLLDDLEATVHKFFDFADLKPADYGEDTISLHVDTNDAYLCADVTLTSNDDNGINEPEAEDGDDSDGPGNGELAQQTNFIWWADDGDNVLEDDEEVISQGAIGSLPLNQKYPLTLADSQTNIWSDEEEGGPAPGNQTLYIGKAWCFGDIDAAPLPQGDYPDGPAGNNDNEGAAGEPEDGGISCDGASVDNTTQTDSLTADITFSATQARHNPDFLCPQNNCAIDRSLNLLAALNGGFETPVVVNGAQWDVTPSVAAGWTVLWRDAAPTTFGSQNRPTIANLEFHRGVLGAAAEGQQYVELDSDWGGPSDSGTGEPASVSIYQDIPTIVGKQYEVHYQFAPRPDTPAAENNVEVQWGGVVENTTGPVAGNPGPIVWTDRSFTVTATTTTTRLQFTDLGTANSLGSFIDDVRVYGEVCGPSAEIDIPQ